MLERIKNDQLKEKVMEAEKAAKIIEDGMNVVTSGFTPAGYPKAVPLALAERIEKGEKLKINLFTGASVGDELDGILSRKGAVARRYPYQSNGNMRKNINSGDTLYKDMHLSHVAQQVRYGFFGNVDVAIVEALEITEDGNIIPTTSLGNTPTYVQEADKIIVEVNTSQPDELKGIHDVYIPKDPPNREPIPLVKPDDIIGTKYVPLDIDKVAAVVVTDIPDNVRDLAPIDEDSKKMANHLIEFLKEEVAEGRLPENLLPIQSGVGAVANAVLGGLVESDFENIDFYSEVIQDSVFDLIDAGKIRVASGTSLTPSKKGLKRLFDNIEKYSEKIILRPQEISNNPEIARRLGSIAINTAIEVDIYGNVNSTNLLGSRMMNGIGGSGDFARNAFLTVFTTKSLGKGGKVSSVVPFVSHIDHTEHDVDVIVTEQGLADLRGLSPRERAEEIIENCVHPNYKDKINNYYTKAIEETGMHTPHMLDKAFSWHIQFEQTGSMK
ncbi:succinyl-CoA:acetate CoA-transferase [Halanaerobium congolense]|jgi:succinyl-CoA:acetate CoA-transferase|uniref:Succinyl-CoA:acetate CoA-transferase n=1 Tax=Halanaerobium congolense TaxID=54121 RepID=A0A1G8IVK3_9FIRM|nr:succinyl-CoA:acetate CoA-transferase [Halanaerobium congolense]SES66178.1 succinyl-CoA:acetate CoA-transferase [Halanaerobium congolense]